MAETFSSGVGKSVGPILLIGGLVVAAYLFRDKIADWIKDLIPGKDDVGAVIENAGGFVPGSIVGQDGQSLDTICKQRYGSNFLWNPYKGACVNGWTGDSLIDTSVPGTTPGVLSDAVNPSGNPVQTLIVPAYQVAEWVDPSINAREPTTTPGYDEVLRYRDNSITSFMAAHGTTREIAVAYLDNTYGLDWESWRRYLWNYPEFAAKVGLPDYSYLGSYATGGGTYVGPNLNPDVPQNDPNYTTIYNPATGAMWSGSAESTSYLMGDSPEAEAWRSRYL